MKRLSKARLLMLGTPLEEVQREVGILYHLAGEPQARLLMLGTPLEEVQRRSASCTTWQVSLRPGAGGLSPSTTPRPRVGGPRRTGYALVDA